MVFSSLTFLFLFLPALLGLYFFPPFRHREVRNLILLVFSLFFYSCGGWRLMPIILFSIAANYLFGRLVAAPFSRKMRKCALILAVVCNLGLLFFFKYMGFLTANLHFFFSAIPTVQILLPIGISFYTFQSLSYVIDVYRGDVPSEKNILRVALYIALFPQLVAGPIVRYSTVADEIVHRSESVEELCAGVQRFLFGLAKKVLLANPMGLMADAAFTQSPEALSAGLAWLGVIAYTAQIYFDFSGYSDMAIGLGRMFGFHFLENFNYPYIATSITDFWRRWHISLSTWFRDYLYIPLGGNRGGKCLQIRNLLIVWCLTGFWHGAAWTFLAWGLFYALLLMGERYLWGDFLKRLPAVFGHVYALTLVMLGWLIFRSSGAPQLFSFLTAMCGQSAAGLWNGQATYLLLQNFPELLLAVFASLPLKLWAQNALQKRENSQLCGGILQLGVPLLALALGALSLMRLISSGFNPFIYFQF